MRWLDENKFRTERKKTQCYNEKKKPKLTALVIKMTAERKKKNMLVPSQNRTMTKLLMK